MRNNLKIISVKYCLGFFLGLIATLMTSSIVQASIPTYISSDFSSDTDQTEVSVSSFNVSADSDSVLLVFVHYNNQTEPTYEVNSSSDGALTPFCSIKAVGYTSELWYLLNPSTGSHTITASWNNSVDDLAMGVVQAANVDQTIPFATHDCASSHHSWVDPFTMSLEGTTTDQLVVGSAMTNSGNSNVVTFDPAGTQLWNIESNNGEVVGGYRAGADSSTSFTWNPPTDWNWAGIMVALNGSGDASTDPLPVFRSSYDFYLDDVSYFSDIPSFFVDDNWLDTFMLVTFHFTEGGSNYTPNSVGFNGDSLTEVCSHQTGSQVVSMWKLEEPASTVGPETVDFSISSEPQDVVVNISLFSEIAYNSGGGEEGEGDPVDPVTDFSCDGGNSDTPSLGLTSNSSSLVIGGITGDGTSFNTFTPGTDLLSRGNAYLSSMTSDDSHKVGEAAATLDWQQDSSTDWAAAGISLAGAVAGDETGPVIQFGSQNLDRFRATDTFEIDANAIDTESGVDSFHSVMYVNTTTYASDALSFSHANPPYGDTREDITIDVGPLPAGNYDIYVSASNGNAEIDTTATFNIDVYDVTETDPPTFDIENYGQEDIVDLSLLKWTGTVTDATAIHQVEFKILDPALNPNLVGSWDSAVTATTGSFDNYPPDIGEQTIEIEYDPNDLLLAGEDGVKSVWIRATDFLYEQSEATLVDRIVVNAEDEAEPIISLQAVAPDPMGVPNPKILGTVKDDPSDLQTNLSSLQCRIDSNPFQDITPIDGIIGDEVQEVFIWELTGLSEGSHTIECRATDSADTPNSTETEGTNVTDTFEISNQGLLDPTSFEIALDFDESTSIDFESTDLIWGGGLVRLAQQFSPVGTKLINNTHMGGQYEDPQVFGDLELSATGTGFWVGQYPDRFVYYDYVSNTETAFSMHDYLANDVLFETPIPGRIKEYFTGTEYHLIVGNQYGAIVLNLGPDPTDKSDDTFGFVELAEEISSSRLVELDTRPSDGFGYGFYFEVGNTLAGYESLKGIYYVQASDISFGSTPKSAYGEGTNIAHAKVYTDQPTENLDNIVEIFVDGATNQIGIADYGDGVTLLNDGGTPTDQSDDTEEFYAIANVFSMGFDDSGSFLFAGDNGVHVVVDGSPVQLAQASAFGSNVPAYAYFIEDEYPLKRQIVLPNRTGQIFYYAFGEQTQIDDELISVQIYNDTVGEDQNAYPAQIRDVLFIDNYPGIDETAWVVATRNVGVHVFDPNQEFVENGVARTSVDPQISLYGLANFFKLDDFTATLVPENISFWASNDAQNFTQMILDERIQLSTTGNLPIIEVRMERGSTPVLEDALIAYSAYEGDDDFERDLNQLLLDDYPSTVKSGADFSFDAIAADVIGNPIDEDTVVTIQLRRSADDAVISAFTLTGYTITQGIDTLTRSANVAGNHYLYMTDGSLTAQSDPILFVADGGDEAEDSGDSSDSDDSDDDSNEDDSDDEDDPATPPVSNNDDPLDIVYLRSDDGGFVEIEDPSAESEVGQRPRVIRFEVISRPTEEGTEVTVIWEVVDADLVEISGVGNDLPLRGRHTMLLESDTQFQLVASNEYGQTVAKRPAKVLKPLEEMRVIERARYAVLPFLDTIAQSPLLATLGVLSVSGAALAMQFANAGGLKTYGRVLQAIGVLPKGKPKGIVFDSSSGKPIPFALLNITGHLGRNADPKHQILETVVTDEYGVYHDVQLNPGSYQMTASHAEYSFPTKKRRAPGLDIYSYYKGEEFSVSSDRDDNVFYVPVDKLRDQGRSSIKLILQLIWRRINLDFLLLPLAAYTLAVTYFFPIWWNLFLSFCYVVYLVIKIIDWLRQPTLRGKVVDQKGRPLTHTIVRITSTATSALTALVTTDARGHFKAYVPNDHYRIDLAKPGYAAETAMSIEEMDARDGAQSKKFTLRKVKLSEIFD